MEIFVYLHLVFNIITHIFKRIGIVAYLDMKRKAKEKMLKCRMVL